MTDPIKDPAKFAADFYQKYDTWVAQTVALQSVIELAGNPQTEANAKAVIDEMKKLPNNLFAETLYNNFDMLQEQVKKDGSLLALSLIGELFPDLTTLKQNDAIDTVFSQINSYRDNQDTKRINLFMSLNTQMYKAERYRYVEGVARNFQKLKNHLGQDYNSLHSYIVEMLMIGYPAMQKDEKKETLSFIWGKFNDIPQDVGKFLDKLYKNDDSDRRIYQESVAANLDKVIALTKSASPNALLNKGQTAAINGLERSFDFMTRDQQKQMRQALASMKNSAPVHNVKTILENHPMPAPVWVKKFKKWLKNLLPIFAIAGATTLPTTKANSTPRVVNLTDQAVTIHTPQVPMITASKITRQHKGKTHA